MLGEIKRESFRPAWWLPGPHWQTLGARYLRPKHTVPLHRQRWTTADDDFLDLDFVSLPGLRDDVLVLVLHGLEGSARSGYAWQLYRQLAARGLPAVGLNFRSCSGELNHGRRFYHSGETSDIAWVIERLRAQHDGCRIAAVGVSLGGNALLKYLGEMGDSADVAAAAAWSVPFDLGAGASFMETGFARYYVASLLRSLKHKVRARAADLGKLIDLQRTIAAKTFREFDDAVTAPLHGFQDADDYYRTCSSKRFLHAIRSPTLVLHSRDDPFLPASSVPERRLAANPCITAMITATGGHVGFVSGRSPLRPCFWAEGFIAAWLDQQLVGPPYPAPPNQQLAG
jgi:predicted alpha/beta-fold hydrolase